MLYGYFQTGFLMLFAKILLLFFQSCFFLAGFKHHSLSCWIRTKQNDPLFLLLVFACKARDICKESIDSTRKCCYCCKQRQRFYVSTVKFHQEQATGVFHWDSLPFVNGNTLQLLKYHFFQEQLPQSPLYVLLSKTGVWIADIHCIHTSAIYMHSLWLTYLYTL